VNRIDTTKVRKMPGAGTKLTMDEIQSWTVEIARLAGIDGDVICTYGNSLHGPCTVQWVDADNNEHATALDQWADPWPRW
jgi:hypothetical protein